MSNTPWFQLVTTVPKAGTARNNAAFSVPFPCSPLIGGTGQHGNAPNGVHGGESGREDQRFR
jgi:hypothetical protein